MALFGVDYAFSPHPSIAALKAAKVKFVVRYIGSKDYTSGRSSKWLNPTEYKALKAAGIAVAVVFETTAKRAEAGKAAGVADAKVAVKELKYCGLPANTPVYMAVDYDTTVGPNITGYLQGVASVLTKSRTGVYGGYKVVKGCFDKGLIAFGWQTYAWSSKLVKGKWVTQWDSRAQLQQYSNGKTMGGASVDYTRAMVSNYGQAGAGAVTPPPPTKPPTKPPTSGGGTVSSAPSWDAVYTLLKKQRATYAKGRKRENVNDYTLWYYGNNTAAQFCFIGISWTLAHAGSSAALGLALIGGKKAYVPYIRNIKGYRAGHAGMKVGAIVAVNGFNHIGFCTKISGSTFELYSFNTTSGGSDDAVVPKTYSLSYASGYVNLAYGSASNSSTTEDDFMAQYVSVDKNSKSPAEVLETNKWTTIYFNQNNSGDASKHHSAGNYPSLVLGGNRYTGTISLRLTGLPAGTEGQIRCHYIDSKGTPVARCDIDEFVASSGDTFVKTAVSGSVPMNQKLRVEVIHYGPAEVQPKVVEGYVRLHVKGV